jgi:SET domain-containing protein
MQEHSTSTIIPGETENPWVEIRPSGIHGQGAFARTAIPAGVPIIEYVGERLTKEESARRCEAGNPYIFCINDEWDLDGNVPENPARFFNHSCAPNCETRQEDDRIWVWTLRDIAPGEELTYNYGYDLESWRDYPCACKAPDCLGYIVPEEHHPTIRRILGK